MKEYTRENTPVEEIEQVLEIWHNVSLQTSRPLSENYGDIDPADYLQNNEKKPLENSLGDSDKKDIELTKDFEIKDVELPQVLLPLDVQNEEVVGHVGANFKSKFSTFCHVDDQDNQENMILSEVIDDDSSDEDLLPRWMDKPIEQWSKTDMIMWYLETACEIEHSFGEMVSTIVMPGIDLLQLSESDFISHDQHFGKKLYDLLQELKRSQDSAENSVAVKSSETLSSHNSKAEAVNEGKVYEYIGNLLLDQRYCPHWIQWTNYELRRFRFIKTKEVAKLWGERRGKEKMTWANFSRGFRNYYKKGILRRVDERQLLYEFDQTVDGLETNDPNFVKANASASQL